MPVNLPVENSLSQLLDLRFAGPGSELSTATQASLDRSLLAPLQDFLGRSGKRLRAQLVALGAEMVPAGERVSGDLARTLELAEAALEAVHAGSMVIDDIEDESVLRRGQATLHRRFGLAPALNAGNWLYFFPLHQIRTWGVGPAQEAAIYRLFHTALLRAHFGQALDVGTPIDELPQGEIERVCLSSIELKSGALTELAVTVGAAVASKTGAIPTWAGAFGRGFGTALQMLDDVGNLHPVPGMEIKRFEDLRLRRPSWVWAQAARSFSADEFSVLVAAIRALPDTARLESLLRDTALADRAKASALEFLQSQMSRLENDLTTEAPALARATELQQVLVKAYG